MSLRQKIRSANTELDEIDAQVARARELQAQLRKVPAWNFSALDLLATGGELPDLDEVAEIKRRHEVAEVMHGALHVAILSLTSDVKRAAEAAFIPVAIGIVAEEVARIHAASGKLAAELDGIRDADTAIQRGKAEQWGKLSQLATDYSEARDVQVSLALAERTFLRSEDVVPYLIVDLPELVNQWRTDNNRPFTEYPYNPQSMGSWQPDRGSAPITLQPVIDARFMTWFGTIPFDAVKVVHPSELGQMEYVPPVKRGSDFNQQVMEAAQAASRKTISGVK